MSGIVAEEPRPASNFSGDEKHGQNYDAEMGKEGIHAVSSRDDADESSDGSSDHKQDGVKRVEAITQVWTKPVLITMFILLYLVSFVDALLSAVQTQLTPYVTSSFDQHGLLSTVSIVATIMGGVGKLTIAKIIDIVGRCEGFILMVVLVVVGMIMKATCVNVEMYAAAHCLYWVGHIGMGYIINIITADITTLRNRMILFGIYGTPLIATTFAGPKIAQDFLDNVNFNWAFGAFAIILVFFAVPVAVIFIWSKRKAVRTGIYPMRPKTRSTWESVKYYVVQFDVVGQILTIGGFSLLLLPFSLAGYAPHGWSTDYIIAMIVTGVVMLVLFGLWEKFYAPVCYIEYKYLVDRTFLGACLLYLFMFLSIYCWDSYYSSYLQVVNQQNVTDTGYIMNSFSLASAIIGPLLGWVVRYFGNFKWPAIAGIPFVVLGTALLIVFRTPDSGVGYLVMCEVFNGIGTGIWAPCGQLAVMAIVGHQEVAVGLAIFGLFGSIGASTGLAVGGALWNNLLPHQIYIRLPEDTKDQTAAIFASLPTQLSYPMGSPEREALIGAYAYVQRLMVITGACLIPLCALCIFCWKNINVKKLEEEKGKQTKGTVF